MAERSVAVKITANTSGFESGMRRAGTVSKATARQIKRDFYGQEQSSARAQARMVSGLRASEDRAIQAAAANRKYGRTVAHIERNRAAYDELGGAAVKLGLVTAAGLGAATKAAMDWESAWAGVTKTVDGSAKQLDALEGQLRGMAKSMPASHQEIAEVAEAAGQLGVKTKDVAGFTKVMIDLGETTNLTADEAATSLAQFMNVMGTASADVGRLGATVVDLGNKGASTERDIVQMGQRIAGAGNQIGLSEREVLGYASALASVGINAEAGGTAISTSFLKIDKHVRASGDELDLLAQTAGMSSSEFKQAWETDAAGALNTFIVGLGNLKDTGTDATDILDSLKIKGIRESDALRRLAGAGDLLAQSLKDADDAWENNTALAAEAAKRYETTESQVRIAWNNIRDAAIEAGEAMLPIISGLADGAREIAEWFGNLPDPLQKFITKAGALVAVTALAGGGLLKMATSVSGLVTSFRDLQTHAPRAAGAIGKIGRAAAIAGLALGALQLIGSILPEQTVPELEAVNKALLNIRKPDGFYDLDRMFKLEEGLKNEVKLNGIADAAERVSNPRWSDGIEKWVASMNIGESVLYDATRRFEQLDESMVSLVNSGAADKAADSFSYLRSEMKGLSDQEIIDLFPQYAETLRQMGRSAGHTFTTAKELANAMRGDLPDALLATEEGAKMAASGMAAMEQETADAQQQVDDLVASLFELEKQTTGAMNAEIGYEQALDDANKAAKEGKRTLNLHTQAGRDNMNALDGMATNAQRLIEEMVRTGAKTKDVTAKTKQAREEFIKVAQKMGASKKEANELADKYGLIPKDVKTKISTPGADAAKRNLDDIKKKTDKLKDRKIRLDYEVVSNGKEVSMTSVDKETGERRNRKMSAYATGGPVYGPGTGTSDDILARLSNGEFVIKQASVDKIGIARLDYMNRTGELPRFRDGGPVETNVTAEVVLPSETTDALINILTAADESIQDQAAASLKAQLATMGAGVRLGSDALVTWKGHRFTENFAKHLQLVYNQHPFSIFQGGFRPATSYSGTSHAGDAVDTSKPDAALIRAMRLMGIAYWDRTGRGNWAPHGHGVPLPGAGKAGGSGVWQAQDYMRGGDGLGGRDYHPNPGLGAAGLSGGTSGANQTLGRQMMLAAGFPASQWPALRELWQRESSWNANAVNPSSGAYGIPQALGHGRPFALGDARAQIAWGLNYIRGRYGTPSAALAFHNARNWYATGGPVYGPGSSTSDDIPAWLSNGEYVINARSTAKYRELLELINADQFARGGAVAGYGRSRNFDVAAIVRLIGAIERPTLELGRFTKAVERARRENDRATKELRRPKQALDEATRAYNKAVRARNEGRLGNTRQTKNIRDRVATASEELKAAKLALDRVEPKGKKAAAAQKALESALSARESKRRANTEQIAKLNDKINNAKKGTLAYTNLINSRDQARKANAREIAAEDAKVAKARKAAAKAGVATAKVEAAQQKVARAQAKLDRLRARQSKISRNNTVENAEAQAAVTKATEAKRKAQERYDKALDRSKAKTDAYKQAQDDLRQAQEAVANEARQVAEAFTGMYTEQTEQGIGGLLRSMRTGAIDVRKFTAQIDLLRKRGLSEAVIDQIMSVAQSQGIAAGSALAGEAQRGGQGMVRNLNDAAKKLQEAADKLGYRQATAPGRAGGGPVAGPGGPRADRVLIAASNGEYVQQASAVDYYGLELMQALNERRIPRRLLPHLAGGGYIRKTLPARYLGQLPQPGRRTGGADKTALLDALAGVRFYIQNPFNEQEFRPAMARIADGRITVAVDQARRSI